MHIEGIPQRPEKVQNWLSTNGLTTYTTVKWVDPSTGDARTSCNCPGWTIKKAHKHRECAHTKDMEGIATCNREKADDPIIIRSAEDAVESIPDVHVGKELRAITF
jgi:hypothetical protein